MSSTWMPLNHLKHFKFVDYKTSTTEDSSTMWWINVLLNLWESIPYCLSSSSVDEVWDSGCVILGTLELCAEGRCCEFFFSECLVI